MSTKEKPKQSIVVPRQLRGELTWGTLLQLILLLALITTGWSNLHSALTVIQQDLHRLIQRESKLETRMDTLPANLFQHEVRVGQLDRPP